MNINTLEYIKETASYQKIWRNCNTCKWGTINGYSDLTHPDRPCDRCSGENLPIPYLGWEQK